MAACGESRYAFAFAARTLTHFKIVSMSWSFCNGFGRYSSISAFIHFSRSPIMACAVRAIMGVPGDPKDCSYSRILAVASNPPCES